MALPMLSEVLRQLFLRPATNKFPAKYLPSSITEYLDKVKRGEVAMNPPVPIPPNFRGKIRYDPTACTGCTLCVKVCPSNAIEYLPETKRLRIYITQCIFCSQCTDICPKGGLSMTEEFLLSDEDRYSENRIVE